MTLSVLIPTLTERKPLLDKLLFKLNRMIIPFDNKIEILTNEDAGEKTTGQKRNELIDIAKGKFSVFIDDDDDIPQHYFETIFKILANNTECDCIGFKGLIRWNDGRRERTDVFKHSVGLPYSPNKVGGEYLRPPNHLNPMLTEYFRAIRFPDLTFAEDFDFCNRLAQEKLIKNEVFIPLVMYYYQYKPKHKK